MCVCVALGCCCPRWCVWALSQSHKKCIAFPIELGPDSNDHRHDLGLDQDGTRVTWLSLFLITKCHSTRTVVKLNRQSSRLVKAPSASFSNVELRNVGKCEGDFSRHVRICSLPKLRGAIAYDGPCVRKHLGDCAA